MTTVHVLEPAWARDFDNSQRHCWWNTKDEAWLLDGHTYGDERTPCPTWREHPRLRGRVEWMRFIHAFGDQVSSYDNPFISEGGRHSLMNEVDGHTTSDGRLTYCETYMKRSENDWGTKPVFRVFLSNDGERWARIECYDHDLATACEQAQAYVEQQYVDEEEAA